MRAPEGYERTTVPEQAGFAAAILRESAGPPSFAARASARSLRSSSSLAEPELVSGTALIEPPLLSLPPEATDQLATDVTTVRDAARGSAGRAALDAYLAGRAPASARTWCGAHPSNDLAAHGLQAASRALFAELSAVPAWERTDAELAAAPGPHR